MLEQSTAAGTRPVSFASRTLTPAERNYSATEVEGLAVVWALKRFRPYLLGHDVTVCTDHVALVHLFRNNNLSGRLARWALTIQEIGPTIKYRLGYQNVGPDALSRAPVVEHDEPPSSTGEDPCHA